MRRFRGAGLTTFEALHFCLAIDKLQVRALFANNSARLWKATYCGPFEHFSFWLFISLETITTHEWAQLTIATMCLLIVHKDLIDRLWPGERSFTCKGDAYFPIATVANCQSRPSSLLLLLLILELLYP